MIDALHDQYVKGTITLDELEVAVEHELRNPHPTELPRWFAADVLEMDTVPRRHERCPSST